MTKLQAWAMASVGGVALLVGVLLASGAMTSAQTPTPSTPAATPSVSPGTFKSNEDPTHEAGEDATREAQEDSGQFRGGHGGPGGKFTPNEDPTHESSESADREAQEDSGQAPKVNPSATSGA